MSFTVIQGKKSKSSIKDELIKYGYQMMLEKQKAGKK